MAWLIMSQKKLMRCNFHPTLFWCKQVNIKLGLFFLFIVCLVRIAKGKEVTRLGKNKGHRIRHFGMISLLSSKDYRRSIAMEKQSHLHLKGWKTKPKCHAYFPCHHSVSLTIWSELNINLCTLTEFRSAPITLMAHKAISTSIYVMNTGNYNSLKFILIHFNFSHLIKQDNICTAYWTKATN